jgi:uncharacterized membrane protein YhaH (DUF805 family)
MNRFYLMINGKQEGPFTSEEIKSRNLDSSTYVLLVGTSVWKKISEISELLGGKVNSNIASTTAPKEKINHQEDKKGMFKNPFSFTGRIRRTEYGISLIIYFFCAFIINVAIEVGGEEVFILFLAFIPMLWFFWAQGAKRCHDRNNSGWYQIIPFYILWLLFAEGDSGLNNYGESPK